MIKLADTGFTLIPEGTQVLKIVEVDYDEKFGKMKISMQTKSGAKHTERFGLIKNNGEVNDGALRAFSYFAKTALNNYNLDEIDEQDLVGCYIKATVTHEEFESNKEPGKMLKSARLSDYAAAASFESTTNDADNDDFDVNVDEKDDLDEFFED